ncbi:hypothetical protein [Endozoicomonas ascidiicola]|uniref:hypothetical protein n=1 Tax=Endozoicomonas ascidiicola TaxID=1698521 RepID=UPI0008304498|nr:hypothetical protein [Endozoicomonas ascidiicola]
MIALELEPCWQDNPIKSHEALPPVDSSPCEAGCPHLQLCQSKELSCQAYHNYANSRKFENSAREPSTFFYEQTFEAPSKNKGVFPTEQKQKPVSPLEDIPVLVTPKTPKKKKEKTVETQTKTRKEKTVMSDKALDTLVNQNSLETIGFILVLA